MPKPPSGKKRSTSGRVKTKSQTRTTPRVPKPKAPPKAKAPPRPNPPPATFQAFVASHPQCYLGVFQARGPIKGGLAATVLKAIKPSLTGVSASYSVHTGKVLWVAFALKADFLAIKTLVGGTKIKPVLVGTIDGFGVMV